MTDRIWLNVEGVEAIISTKRSKLTFLVDHGWGIAHWSQLDLQNGTVLVQVTHHDDVVVRNWIFGHKNVCSISLREVGDYVIADAKALVLDILDQWRQHDVPMIVFLDLLLLEYRLLPCIFEFERNVDSIYGSRCWLRKGGSNRCQLTR